MRFFSATSSLLSAVSPIAHSLVIRVVPASDGSTSYWTVDTRTTCSEIFGDVKFALIVVVERRDDPRAGLMTLTMRRMTGYTQDFIWEYK